MSRASISWAFISWNVYPFFSKVCAIKSLDADFLQIFRRLLAAMRCQHSVILVSGSFLRTSESCISTGVILLLSGSIVRMLQSPSQEMPQDMGGLSGVICNFQFSNISSSNQCSLCGKLFSSQTSCKRHMETSHGNLKFPCDCGKSYTRQTDLHRHQAAAHGNEACVCVCGKMYVYVRGLRAHQKNCTIYKATVWK